MEYSDKLKGVLKQINKSYGNNSVVSLNDVGIVPPLCSTGSLGLDLAIGIGGMPKGRIIEIFGPESSGKTTLCLHCIAEAQKTTSKPAAFVDAEHAFDPTYFEAIGGDLDALIFSQPDNGEHALNIVESLVNSGEVSIIIVDSVAALVPKAELDGEMGDHSVGVHARLMSRAMRKLTAVCSKTETTIIFINQLREKIGIMYGSPETTTGGNALKFYASVRLDIRRKSVNKHTENGEEIKDSNATLVKVIKNKVAPPFKECKFDIVYGKGIDSVSEYAYVADKLGLFKTKAGKIHPNYTPTIWGDEEIESTINFVSDVIKDPEFWVLKEEIYLHIQLKMNQITQEKFNDEFNILEFKFEQEEEHFKKFKAFGDDASGKSKYAEAIYYLGLAAEVKPFDKPTKTKLIAVQKRTEGKKDIDWWVMVWNDDTKRLNVQTGDIEEIKTEPVQSDVETKTN